MKKLDYTNIRKRYLIVFVLILFFSIATQLVIQYFIYSQNENSKVINLAGRQRMLSQRISKLSLLDSKQELEKALYLFTQTHSDFKSGLYENSALTETVKDYQELDFFIDEIKLNAECVLKGCPTIRESVAKIATTTDAFLIEMDKLVSKLEIISTNKLMNLSRIEIFIFILITLILVFEFFFILLPFQKKIFTHFKDQLKEDREKQKLYHMAEIGEISSGIVHEISNFLTLIKGSSKILQRGLESNSVEENIKHLDRIHTNVSRINDICVSMAKVSRISEKAEFFVDEVVEILLDMYSDTFERKGINFQISVKENFKIYSNKTQILQVLFNLVKNSIHALEHSKEKVIRLEISKIDDIISFQISDSGHGIAQNMVDKVLNSYVTTKKEGEGTGLGLSLSRKISNNLGGDLQIVQGPMKTTFLFTLKSS